MGRKSKSKKPEHGVQDKISNKNVNVHPPSRLKEIESEIVRLQNFSRFNKHYEDNQINIYGEQESLKKQVEFLKKDVKDRDAQIAQFQMDLSDEDVDSLKNRAACLLNELQERNARIAELQKTPAGEVYRLKKHLERSEQEIKERDVKIADLVNTMWCKLNQADQAVESESEGLDGDARNDLRLTLKAEEDARPLVNLINYHMSVIKKNQTELNAKIDKIEHSFKDLRQEAKVYYEKIPDPDDFISHVYQNLDNRKTTISNLFEELAEEVAKYDEPE